MWKRYRVGTAFCFLFLILSVLGCSGMRRQTSVGVNPPIGTRISEHPAEPAPKASSGAVEKIATADEYPEARLREESSPVLGLIDRTGAPEGFGWYRIRKGDTATRICGNDPACADLFLRVNRIDARHLSPGRKVLVPIAMGLAERYAPVPNALSGRDTGRKIVVYLDTQYFGAYEDGWLLFWGPVSTGRKGHGTPAGEYRIEYRQKDKKSIKYDGAPMPFALNLSWTGYFLHEQALPGYPASHGCVRLLMDDAKRLFFWVRVGDPVSIVTGVSSVAGE